MVHRFYWLITIALCFTPSAFAADIEADRIVQTVTLTGDPWPPFVMPNKQGMADRGAAFNLINAIFAELPDHEVSIPMMPWKRALKEVELGNIDGIALCMKTEEREEYMLYTDPVMQAPSYVYYSKKKFSNGFEWQEPKDLQGLLIGTIAGYTYGKLIDQTRSVQGFTYVDVTSANQGFKMLAAGHIDLFLESEPVAATEIDALGITHEITASKLPINVDVFYLTFSKKSQHANLIPKINTILNKLNENGIVDQMMRPVGALSAVSPSLDPQLATEKTSDDSSEPKL